MDEYITCPICQRPHRRGARFCPTTGKQLTQPLGSTPTAYTPTANQPAAVAPPVSAPAIPAYPTPGGGALTGQLPANAILNNRYLIIRKIGQGGMAAVYQATDTHLPGTVWAIKEMSDAALPSAAERDYAVQTFTREAQLLRSLNHRNLPKVTDFFTQGGKHYLVMEFVPGQTLDRMLAARNAPFSEADAINWGTQLCDVLSYLHTQNPPIIFRDLKPGNIMLTPQGEIKLIDFGIVRFFKKGQTKDTQALGTPGFFAPEATSGQTDARSDIYSLCVTLHQLLTCCDPSSSMFSLPTARSLNQAVSPGMEAILQRGMQMQRDQRWASTAELRAQLTALASRPPSKPSPGKLVQAPGGAYASGQYQGAGQATLGGGASGATLTSRPTTRLIMAAANLKPWQIGLALGVVVILMVAAAAILTPVLAKLRIKWGEFPIFVLFGALGYAAYPRRLMGLITHSVLTLALLGTIYASVSRGFPFVNLLVATLVSGALIEAWTALLRLFKRRRKGESWGLELIWLALMGPLVTLTFYPIVSGFSVFPGALALLLSPVLSGAAWFLGDLFNQYLTFRQTGLKRTP